MALGVLGTLVAIVLQLPTGWRRPLPNELDHTWRESSSHRFSSVTAEFNGDSVIDEASFLVTEDGSQAALFATVSDGRAGHTMILHQLDRFGDLSVMGIDVAPPGEYETACGKGYWACGPGEPEVLILESPAIDYFANEGGNSFFVWEVDSGSFRRIWISD